MRPPRHRWRWLLVLLLLLRSSSPATAHDLRLSGMRITMGGGKTTVVVTTYGSNLAAAEGRELSPFEIDLALRKRVRLRFADTEFAPRTTRLRNDPAHDLITWEAIREGEDGTPTVLARLYPDDPGSKLIVSVFRDGIPQRETVLDAAHPAALLVAPEGDAAAPLPRFLREGIAHIFGGPDHICFVLGLILLGGGVRVLFKIVSAFTLAHSITLTVATLGIWNPPSRIVEPLIALSIVAIAAETLRPRTAASGPDPRPYLAFAFGLIHGFGFAGTLTEIGLPRHALGGALALFNLGVEIGQAAIVLTLAPILVRLSRRVPAFHHRLTRLVAVGIGIAGVGWFVTRLLG